MVIGLELTFDIGAGLEHLEGKSGNARTPTYAGTATATAAEEAGVVV